MLYIVIGFKLNPKGLLQKPLKMDLYIVKLKPIRFYLPHDNEKEQKNLISVMFWG